MVLTVETKRTMCRQTGWHAHYAAALVAAEQRLKQKFKVACGFTNNVDVLIKIDEETTQTLAAIEPSAPIGQLPPRINRPGDVVNCLFHHIRNGTGDVLAIGSAKMAQWMEDHFHGPLQLGGTGAQAANTLAYLGYEALIHATSLSVVDASVFNGSGRIVVATRAGLRPLAEAIRPDDRPIYHYVFEYQTGDQLNLGGTTVTAPRANRIIMGFDPINAALPIDPLFMKAIADSESSVSRVLISGYTDAENIETACARIATTVEYIRDLRHQRPGLPVHIELAAVTDQALVCPILEEMAPHVDSVGLNEDELVMAVEAWRLTLPQSVEDQIKTLFSIRNRVGVRRINLHTQEYCLTITDYDPNVERDGLLFACLVAGTRARLAKFPAMRDLYDTLAQSEPSTIALAVEQRLSEKWLLNEGVARYRDTGLVFVPTLSMSHPAGTVGLGDSFTAGILVFLDGNRPQSG